MKKTIMIIGGGIVGSTTAFYLSQARTHQLILVDEGIGTATRAAAGIICPWLSQRRNKAWYQLTSQGAAFYPKLMQDLTEKGIHDLPYGQTGTLVFKNRKSLLDKLYAIAAQRKEEGAGIGELAIVEGKGLRDLIEPLETEQGAVLASGGGRVDGGRLIDQLQDCFVKNGGKIIRGKARLTEKKTVLVEGEELSYDRLVLATGAWLKELLSPLGYDVDVRPQKGQLLEVDTSYQTGEWPGCMLHGEIDILPFDEGKLVIGATHEDDGGFDLSIDKGLIGEMMETARGFIPDLAAYEASRVRVGTRAYTSDYSPFYGALSYDTSIFVASGLGSSGLTSGPFIGWQIAQEILGQAISFDSTPYQPEPYIRRV